MIREVAIICASVGAGTPGGLRRDATGVPDAIRRALPYGIVAIVRYHGRHQV